MLGRTCFVVVFALLAGCAKPFGSYDAASRVHVGVPIVKTTTMGDIHVQVEVTNFSNEGLCLLPGVGERLWATTIFRTSDGARLEEYDPDGVMEDMIEPDPGPLTYIGPKETYFFEVRSNIFQHYARDRDGRPGRLGDVGIGPFYVVSQPTFTPCSPEEEGTIYDLNSLKRPTGSVYTPQSDPFTFR